MTSDRTATIVQRFITAFQQKDPSAIPGLVAEDCVMEAIQPAPDGIRVDGYAANVEFWQRMVADPSGSFEVEDVEVCGERAINRWRYRYGSELSDSVRGVTLLRVRDGKIVEALAYAKVPAVNASTEKVIEQFNEAFQRHDPSLLEGLISEDCVIENTDGTRHVGRAACFALWRSIATAPETRFELEDVWVERERAVVRWRMWSGPDAGRSAHGVNVMHVRDGRIAEAFGYLKSASPARDPSNAGSADSALRA